MRISVIIPNYNHAPFLEERIRSILAQTRRPDEIIFLDDASTDDSLAVVSAFDCFSIPLLYHFHGNVSAVCTSKK